jgi:hypothetical protein
MPVTLTNPPYSGADQLWVLGVSIDRSSRNMAIQWGVKKSGKLLRDFNSVVVLSGDSFTDFYEGYTTAVKATGTITVVDYSVLTGATITVGDVVLTEGVEWTASTNNNTTATSLAAAIANLISCSTPVVTDNVISVAAVLGGTFGNEINLVSSNPVNLTVSGAFLTGGLDSVPNWSTDADLYTKVQTLISVNDLPDASGTYTPAVGETP